MEPAQQAKHPVTVLAGPYGHPFHPMLVTVPIGAWVASLVFDIGSRVVSKPGFLGQGSEWLIAIGVLGALAAAAWASWTCWPFRPGPRRFAPGWCT